MKLNSVLKNLMSKKGFTLIELMIVMAIVSILIGIVTINLLQLRNTTSVTSNIDALVSDLRSQQIKAMIGATEGRTSTDSYGIYFLSDQYVLFHGTIYNPADTSNFVVNLPEDLEIQATTLPNNTIVFSQLSGEIAGFSGTSASITVQLINSGVQRVITLNRYGVITGTD